MNRKYRKTVIAGNWKMNKTPTETKAFMTEVQDHHAQGPLVRRGAVRPRRLHPAAVRAMRERRASALAPRTAMRTPPAPHR